MMNCKRLPLACWTLSLITLSLFPSGVYAQASSATVTGIVTDSTGAVVPECNLTLRNVATAVDRTTKTNPAGTYSFPNVAPGAYTLVAEAAGFSRNQIEQFTLAVNQTATFDVKLEVGGVNQTIEVQAQAAQIEASTSELGGVVAQRQVNDLPLNGRNFTQLLALQPGVSPVSVQQNSNVIGLRGTINPAVNGQQNRSNNFYLDGMVNNSGQNSYLIPPIVDTIQEFKLQSHNDEAQFGQVIGGIINVVSKSGTNQLHGSGWEYIRNNAFDARNRFVATPQPFRWNQFGAAGGGPVVIPKLYNGHDKTFFFAAYEGDRLRQAGQNLYRVPTAANFNGDFSDWPAQIYNPYSTQPDPSKPGQFIRSPFPNNQIPVSLLNSSMVYYARSILPTPIVTGVAGTNAIDTTPTHNNVDSYQVRGDHNFSTRDFVFFRWSGRLNEQTNGAGSSSGTGVQGLPAYSYSNARNWVAAYTHIFSPGLVGSFQTGRTWQPSFSHSFFTDLPSNFIQNSGLAPSLLGPYQITGKSEIPGFTVPGFWSGAESSNGQNGQTGVDNGQYKGDLSWVLGRHTLKFGGEYDAFYMGQFAGNATTSIGFTTAQTANPESLGNSGSPLASYFLNDPDNLTKRNVQESLRQVWIASAYIQDQWKVTDRFTINIGLRFDLPKFPRYGTNDQMNKNVGNVDFNNGTYIVQDVPPPCVQGGAAPCIPTPNGALPAHVVQGPTTDGRFGANNYGPRIGFAYRLGTSTVIRSAFGIFYDEWGALTQNGQNIQGVWPSTGQLLLSNLNYPTASGLTPNVTATNPYANAGANALWPSPTPFNSVQWYYDPKLRDPYSEQWNFGIQHQFGAAAVLSANYVGSATHRMDIGTFYNTAVTPGPGSISARQPFPYITPTYWDRPWSNSHYEGLQLQFNKTYSNGLAYSISYTRSKVIDAACSGYFGSEFCSSQNPYTFLKTDRGVAGTDIPNLFSMNWVWELPIGKGKAFSTGHRALDYALGNWQLNGITTLRSGQPYSVYVSGDIANTGNQANYERPNLVGDPIPSSQSPNQWLVRSAFQSPAPFTFGNLGRDTFRTDWGKDVALSLFRQFPFGETRRLEFRAEAFNIFNLTNYGTPANNLNASNFGVVSSLTDTPRQMQFSMKIIY